MKKDQVADGVDLGLEDHLPYSCPPYVCSLLLRWRCWPQDYNDYDEDDDNNGITNGNKKVILISSTKPIPNPFMRHTWSHNHSGLGKISIWQWNLVRCIWFQNIMRQGPGWNDHNFLLHCYSAGTIHGGCAKVYSSPPEVQIISESIEYIISKIPGPDNYENCPNIPNIDGGSSDTRQVSDDGQTE